MASTWVYIPLDADYVYWYQAVAQIIDLETHPVGLIFGSGFEHRPHFIEDLSLLGILLGNTANNIRLLKDPHYFFSLLQSLHIPAPETQSFPPINPIGWLRKTIGGTGGQHVLSAMPDQIASNCYYQRKLEGQLGSVLFLANGKEAQILGYNRLELTPIAFAPYRYGGISAPLAIDPVTHMLMQSYLTAITAVTGLLGLNGLDFIQTPTREIKVLEINPRPPTSLDLYQDLFNPLDAHIRACLGVSLPIHVNPMLFARAFSILYAPHSLRIPQNVSWPHFCHDYPIGNYSIEQGEPICSVHAQGISIEHCWQQLQQHQSQVLKLLTAT
ncbi:hypothetical conserved protein [Candidatus Nitrosoglobus terrae]|uniref:Hypothetical conserved protein n=1 Tax=Candidatus Nitrosoglobus terrae TaxID=1630141 RepID=A0A1Q2SPS9_9GAMM|nr:ATP-grasp domain-containing protein [Candidatus Nitrosoglobus terrae]BAW81123.1 hypothetical conserved protein [Candidatus Nitrosoglobus terrae]